MKCFQKAIFAGKHLHLKYKNSYRKLSVHSELVLLKSTVALSALNSLHVKNAFTDEKGKCQYGHFYTHQNTST